MWQKVTSHKFQEFITPLCHSRVMFPPDTLEFEVTSRDKGYRSKFLLIAYRITHGPRFSHLHGCSPDLLQHVQLSLDRIRLNAPNLPQQCQAERKEHLPWRGSVPLMQLRVLLGFFPTGAHCCYVLYLSFVTPSPTFKAEFWLVRMQHMLMNGFAPPLCWGFCIFICWTAWGSCCLPSPVCSHPSA